MPFLTSGRSRFLGGSRVQPATIPGPSIAVSAGLGAVTSMQVQEAMNSK